MSTEMSEEMASQAKRYEKYAKLIKTLFVVVGLWPGPGLPKFSIHLVYLYTVSIIIVIFANINFVMHNLKNVGGMTQAMGTCISTSTSAMKAILFLLYRNEMKKMHKILENQFRNDFSKPELQSVLLSPLRYFHKSATIMSKVFIALSVALAINPCILIIIQLCRGANPIHYELPLPTTYPWDHKSSIAIFVAHYFFEGFVCMSTGTVSVTVDTGLGFYVFQIATQFRALGHRLSLLDSKSDYRRLIRECVLRRRILTDCCNTLERVYGPIALWLMISTALSLCVNIYQLAKIRSGSIATTVLYIMMKFLQSLSYGWTGTFLTTETESFRDAVYSSGWAGSGEIPFMTSIRIMLMWKPLVLTAWSFSTISLDMFVATLNTAISYFFCLTTLDEGN